MLEFLLTVLVIVSAAISVAVLWPPSSGRSRHHDDTRHRHA